MGLLDKIATEEPQNFKNTYIGPGDIQTAIADFHQKNSLFHCIVMHFADNKGLSDIAEMTAFHGVACYSLKDSNGLVMLPGGLDMELFSNRLSKSTGSTVLFQFSANSSSLAFETLSPYLR